MEINDQIKAESVLKELSYRAKEYRISCKLTQKELADAAMVSLKTLTRFENGEDISLERFIRILSALGISSKLEILIPDPSMRPSSYLPERKGKKRVRHGASEKENSTGWKWGDEV